MQRCFAERSGGAVVPLEQIERVVEYLDQTGFLDSPRFTALRENIERSFQEASARPAYLAGKSYPEDADELRAYLDGFFTAEGGPGALPAPGAQSAPPLRALIVPHIDFARGHAAYAHAYSRLYAAGPPKTVFVFGVAHAGAPVPFITTCKDFETPFGTVEADREAVDEIEAACGWNPREFEIVHRKEHSIEFQAVMLAYLYGPNVKLVPILCSLLAESPDAADPARIPAVSRFLEACRLRAADPARRVTVIAGADLAHVGRRFGDEFDIDADVIEEVRKRDFEDLGHARSVSPESWYASVMRDGNERRVCGLASIYATLKSVEGAATRGDLLHYGYAPDPSGGIVSFASIQFV